MTDRIDQEPIPPDVWDDAIDVAGGVGPLAERLDVHRNTVSNWRRGETKCSGMRARAMRPVLRQLLISTDSGRGK